MTGLLQQIQADFIGHIKDPEHNEFDYGIESRRMAIYRDLFFNNLCGFLDNGFPVLKSIYDDEKWLALARNFYAKHQCRSPYMVDISKAFVEYLNTEYKLRESDPVFVKELAHYEWLELDVSIRKITRPHVYWDGQSAYSNVSLSELAAIVSYPFPVHQISQDFQPQQPAQPCFYLVFRDEQDEVSFLLINQVTAYMLNLLEQQGSTTVEDLIAQMQQAMPQLAADLVASGARQSIHQLLEQQILLPE